MKQNLYSRKLRQFRNLSESLNVLFEQKSKEQRQIKRLIFRIKALYNELKNAFSSAFIKKTLAGTTFVFGLFFGNSALAQSFSAPVNNPFNIGGIYALSKCTVNDFDGDGDQDMMLISPDTVNNLRQFTYLQNIGTASIPNFQVPQHSPFSLESYGEDLDNSDGGFAAPTAVDIDNDGDLDIMAGKGFDLYNQTRLIFAENIGTATNPNFAALENDPFNISFLNPLIGMTVPAFVDIDNDGDQDLFVGHYYGSLLYFQNTGTSVSPNFTSSVENPFGITTSHENSTPTFSDFDGDGDQDLLLGSRGEDIFEFQYFENTGTAAAASFAAPATNPFGLDQGIGYKIPSNLTDMDGDGDKDLFTFFYYDEGLEYYENTSAIGVGISEFLPTFESAVYPSPTDGIIHLDIKGNTNDFRKIEVIDISGKVVLTFNTMISEINLKNLNSGFYTIKVIDKSGKATQNKLQKI